ncbi:DUF1214 domain-containing protein [Roseibium sp.]|uniref:DUF1214 domain-containing protein n=1 Tax=Roseibium sp. TaxID=1936156 RepID=UPI003A96C9FC
MNADANINRSRTTPLIKLETVREGMATDLPVSEADFKDSALPPILRPQRPLPVRNMITAVAVLFAGALLGIATAYVAIERERPFLAVNIGPWSSYPKAGTADADPYSVAIYTRSARVPLASGEGLALSARFDSSGRDLDPGCSYRISGTTPTARLWTLTASDIHGRLQKSVAGRVHISSDTLLRRDDGSFSVTASRTPHSGNWLPLGQQMDGDAGLMFTFRLYDAPVTTGSALDGAVMPAIERLSCP